MAPVDESPGPLSKYLNEKVPGIIEEYDKLWQIPDPEEDPYKSKYEARKLLEAGVKEIERLWPEATSEETDRGSEMLAQFFLYLGKNYYFCEEVPTAEQFFNRSLERYLRSPFRLQPETFVCIQDAFNNLGMLWCNRQGHKEGMNFLRRAQIMFEKRPEAVRQHKVYSQQSANGFTLTMFFLAQAYGALQKPALSARFCAETMSQQLEHNTSGQRSKEVVEKDPFDCKDWVRNCCSLSDFFVNEAMFWTAEYLLHAAAIMCERCEEICGLKPEGFEELKAECTRDIGNYYSTRLKFLKTCVEYPESGELVWSGSRKAAPTTGETSEGSRLTFQCAADAAQGANAKQEDTGKPIVWDVIFPEVVHLEDEEAQDNGLAEETGVEGEEKEAKPAAGNAGETGEGCVELGRRSVGWLEYAPGERVRLPVHFRRLHSMVERRIQRANAGFIVQRLKPPPPHLVLEEGDKEAVEGDTAVPPRQPTCVGPSFEAAREIFRVANHYQLKALGYFLLEGWVTEHVRILQEVSQMYRTMLFWEQDHKRAAAMKRRRLRMLAPLLEVLNPKVYVAFWRQISFEVAEVYQQLYDLKVRGKLGESPLADDEDDEPQDPRSTVKLAARCNDLASKSLKYYTTFIESYHTEGKIPDRIDDDNCQVYLTARVNRARLRTKVRGLSREDLIEAHKLALREYEWLVNYKRRHPEVATNPQIGMAKELALCEEMVGMLPSKLSQIAAGRRM